MKKIIISRDSFYVWLLLSFLFVISIGLPFIQFIGIPIIGLLIVFVCKGVIKFGSRMYFYIVVMLFAFFQVILFWKDSYSLNYIINSLIAAGMWGLMLIASLSMSTSLIKIKTQNIHQSINIFFKLNIILMIFQYIIISIEKGAIIPYSVSMGAGDFIKGFFANSSVSMIILSFYVIYFYFKNDKKNLILSVIFMIASTYMSGIVIFLGVILLIILVKFSLITKLKILLGFTSGILAFYLISPENVNYVVENLTVRLYSESDQARKIISFMQTKDYISSGLTEAIFGAGGGKFSSRTAFLTSGDYVSWYPQNFKFISSQFEDNHFSLWNSELLKEPYKDGTANQPFSFYNKIFGEYGLLGFIIFLILYLGKWLNNIKNLTYGKYILFLMMFYFILDYWFEYFTVIIFCELFISLDLKENFTNKKPNNTAVYER